jgi:microcystin-dependent protein
MPKFVNTLSVNSELDSDPTADEGTLYYNKFTDELKIKGASTWSALGGATTTEMPTGSVITWVGAPSTPPSGWLLCDGAAVSRSTYSDLFAITSTYFGAGDGSTTFNLPDFRGLSLVGAVSANLGVAVGNTSGGKVWTYGSADPFTALTHSSDNALHTHTFTDDTQGGHTHTINHSTTATNQNETDAGGHSHTYTATPSTTGHSHTVGSTGAASGTVSVSITSTTVSVGAASHTHAGGSITGGNSHTHSVTESVSSSGNHAHGFANPTVPSYTGTSGAVSGHTHGGTMAADGTAAHTHSSHSANRARVWYLVKS